MLEIACWGEWTLERVHAGERAQAGENSCWSACWSACWIECMPESNCMLGIVHAGESACWSESACWRECMLERVYAGESVC